MMLRIRPALAAGEGKRMNQSSHPKEKYSSPEITIESSLCIFPTTAHITRFEFGSMFQNIDYPLCPHLQLGEALDFTLFSSQLTANPNLELVEG